MDDINGEFARTDVALVIGANDVTNPAARNVTGLADLRHADPRRRQVQLGRRAQALDGLAASPASTTRSSTTRRPRCCSATRRPPSARCSPRSRRCSERQARGSTSARSPAATRPDRSTRALRPKRRWWCASRWRRRSAHFSCVSGSRVGIAQRSHGWSRRSTTPLARSERPALPALLRPGRRVELEVEVGAEPAQVDLRAELALQRPEARVHGDEDAALEVLDAGRVAPEADGSLELGLERTAQARIAPAVGAAVRRGHRGERRIVGLQAGVLRERVRGAPGEQPRRLAGRQRLPRALVLDRDRVRAVAAHPAPVDPRGAQRLPRHRLDGPAPQLGDRAGDHRRTGRRAAAGRRLAWGGWSSTTSSARAARTRPTPRARWTARRSTSCSSSPAGRRTTTSRTRGASACSGRRRSSA